MSSYGSGDFPCPTVELLRKVQPRKPHSYYHVLTDALGMFDTFTISHIISIHFVLTFPVNCSVWYTVGVVT